MPAHVPRIGRSNAPDRLVEPVEPHQAHERRRLPAGNDEPVEILELLGLPHLDRVDAEPPQHRRRVRGSCPGRRGRRQRGRITSLGSRAALRARERRWRGRSSHRPARARPARGSLRRCSASSPRRSPWRARSGSPDLKIPEPTKTPSAPSCMQSAASAGVAIPPAVKVTTGRRPFSATQRTSSHRRLERSSPRCRARPDPSRRGA